MAEWLAQAPVLRRVAFGAILYEPVNQRSDAYRRLADFVPGLTIDAATSRDFLYQINKPRVSKVVQGLDINRLSKWSAALRRPVSMELALGVDQPNVLTKMTAPGANAVRLELDINTALEFGAELPADSRGALFRELAALGREIAQHGDIA